MGCVGLRRNLPSHAFVFEASNSFFESLNFAKRFVYNILSETKVPFPLSLEILFSFLKKTRQGYHGFDSLKDCSTFLLMQNSFHS